ncbi:hypothetical protein [Plantactinospora sp. BC1]|uniref:hypothetical protein n=1 Tax=Plantactinospora sp. BC1 TaxID=2108470 RepID=UPI0018FEE7B0|nr:hypothetical protein [Plantactinospora sp. BC1]
MPGSVSGGASSAVAASAHASCARFRGTDPLVTGVTRRKLAQDIGHSKGQESAIPLLRWMRAMTFEGLIQDKRFASEVVTIAVGGLGLARPTGVVIRDAGVNVIKTAAVLDAAHKDAIVHGRATLIYHLAVPFVGLDGVDATTTRPDFAVVAPRHPNVDGEVDSSWLIVGDAKDYQRVRAKIDDAKLMKGFLQVALGAESAAQWSQLPAGMEVHTSGVLAVPRNTSLNPTAVIEDLTDYRDEVRMRVVERQNEVARFPDPTTIDPLEHLAHLTAHFDPASCAGCDLFIFCRKELQSSKDPADLLIELGVKPEMRQQAIGLIDKSTPLGPISSSARSMIEATLSGVGVKSRQRRLDPIGQSGTVNVVMAKSDGATLGVYGIALQCITAQGAGAWDVTVFDNPDSDATRRQIMKLLGKQLFDALSGAMKANTTSPEPIHVVVPDSGTADLLVGIADSIAGSELSRLRWQRDKDQDRPALTFGGEPAVIPPRLPEKDRTAVSFLLEQDRARTMKCRIPIVDLRATLAALVTAGGPSVNSLRVDYLYPWATSGRAPIDFRAHSSLIEKSPHTVGAQLTTPQSNAIHEAFTGDKPGLPRPANPAAYDSLVRDELAYKTDVFDKCVATLESEFAASKLRSAVRQVEGDSQIVWRRRLDLHAFDLVRFSRTSRFWRNDNVPVLEADKLFVDQLTILTSPLTAHDAAVDAGNQRVAIARVVGTAPYVLEVDSRRIGDQSRVVALHVNGEPCVEEPAVTVKIQKGSFKISNMAIGPLAEVSADPRQFQWDPHHDPGVAVGDELIVADFAWFSTNTGDAFLNVPRPSVDQRSAPKPDCTPDSYGDDPASHQYCCKPHEVSEAEWSDELAARRASGRLNPQTWPPIVDPDAFDVAVVGDNLPDPAAEPAVAPPEDLSMDDVE